MYVVESGSVGIYLDYGQSYQKELAVVNDGIIGEMGFFCKELRSATGVALEDTELTRIDDSNYKEYFDSNPTRLVSLFSTVSDRLKNVNSNYSKACSLLDEYNSLVEKNETPNDTLIEEMKKLVGR